ncbi:ATP-dependent RNA helicase DDX51 [Myxocyprinus asiaticus]|uniref:ATP-dependent RNA helicase DDX51 n=1 Tax=Myxocyprinus asiaticus TaxID=70543 RepID=UPI0022214703|nr:ATP-dependent RNA helicase DDX51 [Myxocyprinus asiaticus]
MALFTINRYLGEEEEENSESNGDCRSRVLLAKLQEQAKAREQQSKSDTTDKDGDHQSNTKHKKKRKHEQRELEGTQRKTKKETTDLAEEAASPTKKQKHKTLSIENESVNTGDDVSNNGSSAEIAETCKGDPEGSQKTGKVVDPQIDQLHAGGGISASETSFQILGGFKKKTVEKVKRVLPQWLAQPDVVQRDIKSHLVPIHELRGISPKLLKKLEANGIKSFFPVQAEVIPAILGSVSSGLLVGPGGYRPRDICVSAPTGSGKTLTFVLPIIQALSERVVCEVRALAVLPTKELAQQVSKVFFSYAEGTGLKVVLIAGKKSLAAECAALSENRGGIRRSFADIVVATPGRLVDHINKNDNFSLQHLRFLIVDEADRMIDGMDQSWLSEVIKAVYRSSGDSQRSLFTRIQPGPITVSSLSPPQLPLQKLLFSATLTQNPEKLQLLNLHQPQLFSATHTSSDPTQRQEMFMFPQGLSEYYVPCTLSKKPLLILHYVLRLKFSPALCFTNSIEAAHRLYLLVKLFGGVEVAEFSSRMGPSERQRTLKEFEQGKILLLISTDAAARGIDIKGVKCIINYDAPQYIRTYIHRVGRTARAGKVGLAFTFLLKVQEKRFLQMVADAGSPGIQRQLVQPESLKSMESRYEQKLAELNKVVKEENAKKWF